MSEFWKTEISHVQPDEILVQVEIAVDVVLSRGWETRLHAYRKQRQFAPGRRDILDFVLNFHSVRYCNTIPNK